jgi:hypothetical protein
MKTIHKLGNNRLKIALVFFIISAFYGLYLRLFHIVDLPLIYKNTLQAHSHVTFLGWGFLAVISLISFTFESKKLLNSSYLNRLFFGLVFSLVGMLISFPLQGYKLFSIIFLSIFLLISYLYLFQILKALKPLSNYSSKFIKTGIFYYFLSSLAIWMIAIIAVKYGKTTLYHNAIYFYLHFLYNGFFVFALFGLIFKYFEDKQIAISQKHIKYFFYLTNLACIPAYALSLLWTKMPVFVYLIAFTAGFLQLISLYYLSKIRWIIQKNMASRQVKFMFSFFLISYFIKIVMQFFSVFPTIMEKALQLKSYFIIGYLHLFTLAFMSIFILFLWQLLVNIKLNKRGVNLLILGVFLSELFLFLQGVLSIYSVGINNISLILFLVSALMPIGLLFIYFNLKKNELSS